jgi:alanine dehydrogenase
MRFISASDVDAALDYPSLIERLRAAFRSDVEAPLRQHYTLPAAGRDGGTLLVMPAWRKDEVIGVKVVTVMPGNAARGLATVMGVYLLLDGRTGAPLAVIDGPSMTRRRTAATSALAADYLARPDCARLVMVGTGALAPCLVEAHASVRPIAAVLVWGRTAAKADALARRLDRPGLEVRAATDLEGAVRAADIVSCATMARAPLIEGLWLRPGAHLDLVGGFTPEMREADDEAIRRARLFVDRREAALSEAGDVIQPIAAGVIGADDIAGDLGELAHGVCKGRTSRDEITVFKSVGTATADLAAARQALDRA